MVAVAHCLRLLMQAMSLPRALARPKVGSSNPASTAMMAITTSNSINVKPGPEPA
jgi:hypothetical protein